MILEELPGVGPALARSIRTIYRDPAIFLRAVEDGDLDTIAAVPGLTGRAGVRLVRRAKGFNDDRLLATEAAHRLYEDVLERITSFACTPAGRHRIQLLAPLQSREEASKFAAKIVADCDRWAALPRHEIATLLGHITKAKNPPRARYADRVAICFAASTANRLAAAGLEQYMDIGGPEELATAGDRELVFIVGDGPDVAGENVIELPDDVGLLDLVPEAITSWADHNRSTFAALGSLLQIVGQDNPVPDDLHEPPAAPVQIAKAVETTRAWAEKELPRRLASVAMRGDELLAAMGRGLPAAIAKIWLEIRTQAREQLRVATGIPLQPFLDTLPISIDDEEVHRVEAAQEARSRRKLHDAQVRRAKTWMSRRPAIEEALQWAFRFDAEYALASFASVYQLHAPRWSNQFTIEGSLHLELVQQEGTPVTYQLGENAPAAILTGANSGGKSTLLEMLAQITIMGRLGLPVSGQVSLPWIEELHVLQGRGSMDAGAFETFLRRFMPLVFSAQGRLVLADEVEAMTELQAAGRILAYFLDRLVAGGGMALLVSHMATEILQAAKTPIRVDGIHARGLDEHNRLIVDRVPRMGEMARSTPELIVERLAATSEGQQRALFGELLAAIRGEEAKRPPSLAAA